MQTDYRNRATISVKVPRNVKQRILNEVYWMHGMTQSQFVSELLERALDLYEKENGIAAPVPDMYRP